MLDVRGNCSILRRSCVTQPFVWRGSTRVLAGPARVPRVPRTSRAALAAPRGSIPSGSFVWRGSTRAHAGPRRSGRVYIIESCSLASCTTQPFVWCGSTRVPRRRGATRVLHSSRGSHAGHAALAASRVHSITKRCGPSVWRGSTRILEEARERV